MTELELYKFITKNNIFYEYFLDENNEENVCIHIDYKKFNAFCELITPFGFDEEGIKCILFYKYLAISMKELCEMFNIEINNIFEK